MDPKDIPTKVPRLSYKEPDIPGSFPVDEDEEDKDMHRFNDASRAPDHGDATGLITNDGDANVPEEEKSTPSDTSHNQNVTHKTTVP
ncbi:hypothetical protein ST47_g1581 [Ascochyta rabiei]|uniref:Uncharacterized protein n=2 Tax=Didymella rabiei TaxID=5454 RepID=A0A163KVE2_DIDRA|nr:hypothetical protein ST47_g1581 [Ascochyta rabiei]